MKKTAVFIGAGYSHVAGLPLARDLFDAPTYLPRDSDYKRWQSVVDDFGDWCISNPGRGPEQYLSSLYSKTPGPQTHLYEAAVEFITATLATPMRSDYVRGRVRYSSRLSKPYPCEAHEEFWNEMLESTDVQAVVTTNYDLLIERSLRHRPMKRPYRPGFHYGGFQVPLKIEGKGHPFPRDNLPVVLRGGVPVYKLHGSLNWALGNSEVTVYVDVRPAFRRPEPGYRSAIVPPVDEKDVPRWLRSTWVEAETCLRSVQDIIVCGYSLPTYDKEVTDLLRRGMGDTPKRVFVLDPNSSALSSRYSELGSRATVIALPGLPEGTELLSRSLREE